MNGLIFNIQRFSLQDGPGIRTTVFFKGCSLNCFWCHNPESKMNHTQLQVFSHLCLGCMACVQVCPANARSINEHGQLAYDRSSCTNCGSCADVCPSQALIVCGQSMKTDEVMQIIRRDQPFYDQSDGGITLSGGEPLLQADFAASLLSACRSERIHTAVDTAGHVSWSQFEKILSLTDLFLYDIKGISSKNHQNHTGTDNRLILQNLERLAASSARLIIRIPIIPGHNDNLEEMRKTAEYLKQFSSIELIEFSPYHNLAEGKTASLGLAPAETKIEAPTHEECLALIRPFQEYGLPVRFLNH